MVDSRKEFDSLAAEFGMPFDSGLEYLSRLQYLPLDPYLCGEDSGEAEIEAETLWNEQRLNAPKSETWLQACDSSVVIPPDGSVVALLAKKGKCTFEKKARVAMELCGYVQYIIVYHDEAKADLIPMVASKPSGITIGAQFISLESGLELKKHIDLLPWQTRMMGGTQILIDSYAPWEHPNEWIGWMLMIISCFGSFLLCIRSGNETGTIVIVGDYERSPGPELLSEEDVHQLHQFQYTKPKDSDASEKTQMEKSPKNCSCDDYHSDYKLSSCIICLDEFDEGDKMTSLRCRHSFHTKCIVPWLTERQPTCPLCKEHALESDLSDSESEEHSIIDYSRMEEGNEPQQAMSQWFRRCCICRRNNRIDSISLEVESNASSPLQDARRSRSASSSSFPLEEDSYATPLLQDVEQEP